MSQGNHTPESAQTEMSSRSLSLSEKVRSLRLADKMNQGGGASSTAVYVLSVAVIALAAGVGYNVYSSQNTLKKIDELEKKIASSENKDEDEPVGEVAGRPETGDAPRAINKDEIALQYKGFIVPISQILVSPEVGGKVVWLKFREGQNVKVGEKLAEIEDIKYRAEYEKAVATWEAAKSRVLVMTKYRGDEVKQLKAELEEASALQMQYGLEFKRSTELRSTGALAAREYEEAESKFKSNAARLKRLELASKLLEKGPRDEQIAAAEQEVKAAAAQVVVAKKSLDDTVVRAPVTGTILTKKAEESNQVNPAAFSNGLSASLCEMADLTELEVDVAVVERDRSMVKVNQECRIRVDAWPRKVYEGYVSRIMPQADLGKNAIPVRVKITKKRLEQDRENGGPFLLPQMSAVVMFLNSTVDPVEFEKR